MKNTFTYGEYRYEHYVEFTERKSFSLTVRPDSRIIVRAPLNATLSEIEAFMVRKWRWLEKQLTELRKYQKTHTQKQYISGEEFYYLGRQYMLLVTAADVNCVKLHRGKLNVATTGDVRDGASNQRLVEQWLSSRRKVLFKAEYAKALRQFNFAAVPELGERVMATRWGSHTSNQKIFLNPRLIHAPRDAIYYVCVHELCHSISKKHDEQFYAELTKRLPNWRRIKETLEINFG